MKPSTIIVAGLLSAVAVQAEVKPKNTVLSSICGNLNRSESICVARNQTTKTEFVQYRHFRGQNAYGKATVKDNTQGQLGVSNKTYTGTLVIERNRYAIEEQFELTVTSVVRPGAKMDGELKIDGKVVGKFPMEAVVHTQSAGE